MLAPLRDQRFFSVAAINQAIRPLLDQLNAQPFQKLEGSRDSWFESQEKDDAAAFARRSRSSWPPGARPR